MFILLGFSIGVWQVINTLNFEILFFLSSFKLSSTSLPTFPTAIYSASLDLLLQPCPRWYTQPFSLLLSLYPTISSASYTKMIPQIHLLRLASNTSTRLSAEYFHWNKTLLLPNDHCGLFLFPYLYSISQLSILSIPCPWLLRNLALSCYSVTIHSQLHISWSLGNKNSLSTGLLLLSVTPTTND